jgi:hypothetical protein
VLVDCVVLLSLALGKVSLAVRGATAGLAVELLSAEVLLVGAVSRVERGAIAGLLSEPAAVPASAGVAPGAVVFVVRVATAGFKLSGIICAKLRRCTLLSMGVCGCKMVCALVTAAAADQRPTTCNVAARVGVAQEG